MKAAMFFNYLSQAEKDELREANALGHVQFLSGDDSEWHVNVLPKLHDWAIYRIKPDVRLKEYAKPFGEMNDHERVELMLSFYKDHQPLEFRTSYSNDWIPITDPTWHDDCAYRIKPKVLPIPISFEWSHLDSKFRFIAKDSNGDIFAYETHPTFRGDRWCHDTGKCAFLDNFASLDAGNIAAEDSLIVRPGVDE